MPNALQVLFAGALLLLWPFAAGAQPGGDPVRVSAQAQFDEVHPGDQFAVAVVIDLERGWHIWPPKSKGEVPRGLEDLSPFWTRIGPAGGAWIEDIDALPGRVSDDGLTIYFGDGQWPAPHPVTSAGLTGQPVSFLSYDERAVVFIPVAVARDAKPGSRNLDFIVQVQACDDSVCVAPEDLNASVAFEVVAPDAVRSGTSNPIFAAFSQSVFANLDGGATPSGVAPPLADGSSASAGAPSANAIPIDFFGYFFSVPGWSIWIIAFLAGLILNLTPCVLPVVPIKVLSLQQHAKEPGKLALFGIAYCLGIIAFFAVLAVLVAIFGQAWGKLNGYWWFSIPLAVIVGVMGLAMVDLFAIRLPQSVYVLNPSGDTVGGNFMLGGLTAILSTPCTGPMLAGVIAWAATQPKAVGVLSVLIMGLGMASPYALLIAFPKWIERIPRTGPGSLLLKQVLGLLMLAVAVYILSFLTTETWTWWLVGLLSAAAFVWMYVGGLRLLKGVNAKIVVTHAAILGLIITAIVTRAMTARPALAPAGGTTVAANGGAIPWRVYKGPDDGAIGDAVNAALGQGKVVVMDFTAKWCVNCHVIERTILNSELGRSLLTHPGVVPIKVDITHSSYKDGHGVLQEFSGAASIPFLAVMGPGRGRDNPITYASFFKPSDLESAVRVASNGSVGMALAPAR